MKDGSDQASLNKSRIRQCVSDVNSGLRLRATPRPTPLTLGPDGSALRPRPQGTLRTVTGRPVATGHTGHFPQCSSRECGVTRPAPRATSRLRPTPVSPLCRVPTQPGRPSFLSPDRRAWTGPVASVPRQNTTVISRRPSPDFCGGGHCLGRTRRVEVAVVPWLWVVPWLRLGPWLRVGPWFLLLPSLSGEGLGFQTRGTRVDGSEEVDGHPFPDTGLRWRVDGTSSGAHRRDSEPGEVVLVVTLETQDGAHVPSLPTRYPLLH